MSAPVGCRRNAVTNWRGIEDRRRDKLQTKEGEEVFRERTRTAERLHELLVSHYWDTEPIRSRAILLGRYGYETHLAEDVAGALRTVHSPTSLFVRFAPDAVLVLAHRRAVLLELKATLTPRYSLGERQWEEGQIEASAWETYLRLRSAAVSVAVIIYCPYHPRPLLCDFPSEEWVTRARTAVAASTGSGTDYVNVDLARVRTFRAFMEDEFGVPVAVTDMCLSSGFWSSMLTEPSLMTRHAAGSPVRDRATGFNWMSAETASVGQIGT